MVCVSYMYVRMLVGVVLDYTVDCASYVCMHQHSICARVVCVWYMYHMLMTMSEMRCGVYVLYVSVVVTEPRYIAATTV